MTTPGQPVPEITEAVERSLQELGVHDAAALAQLFSQLEQRLQAEASQLRAGAADAASVEAFRIRWLGRKQGILRGVSDNWLRSAPVELKREIGQRLNALREEAEQALNSATVLPPSPLPALSEPAREALRSPAQSELIEVPMPSPATPRGLDVTLPGARRTVGVRHPLRRALDEITEIFFSLGYSVEDGPEIESVYYNFEALNIPEDHPSRDDQDTFYIDGQTVLRTHTSPVQIRTMEKQPPPLRIIVLGKVYRNETPDAGHSCMFHQVEGLAVDAHITFADLKGTLDYFMKAYFGSAVRTRFRPSFFPFTEPSAEMDVSCILCGGTGCRVCKGTGWLELGGCGMVDPAVFAYVRYDASRYSGFAFGFGVERLAMLKYGVPDIQLFFQSDIRFLHQFR